MDLTSTPLRSFDRASRARHLYLSGTLLLAMSLGVTRPAHANAAGWTTLQSPAVACQGGSAWSSEIGNWGSTTVPVWCPLLASWNNTVVYYPSNIYVDVNHGWAGTNSCNAYMSSGPNNWWIYPASAVQNNGSYDTVVINMPGGYSFLGQEVECYLPPGGNVMLDYRFRQSIYYDWWNN